MLILVLIFPNYFYRIIVFGYVGLVITLLIIPNLGVTLNDARANFELLQESTYTPKVEYTSTPKMEIFYEAGYLQRGNEKCAVWSAFHDVFPKPGKTCIIGKIKDYKLSNNDSVVYTFSEDFEVALDVDNLGYFQSKNIIDKCIIIEGSWSWLYIDKGPVIINEDINECTFEALMLLDYSEKNIMDN